MSEEKVDELKKILLPLIEWNSPIRDFTEEDIKNMATSLRVHGLIHPIICKPPNDEGIYEGVCGRLRYEAAKHAHIPEILVRLHEFKDEGEVFEWQLAENLHRKDLTVLQKAEWYRKLYDLRRERVGGVKDKSIVAGIAMSIQEMTGERPAERTVEEYIQVAKDLPNEVKDKIANVSDFGVGHALQALRLKDKPERQLEIVDKFLEKPVSVRGFKRRVDEVLKPPEVKPKPPEEKPKLSELVKEAKQHYPLIMIDAVYEYLPSEEKLMPTLRAVCEILWEQVEAKGEGEVKKLVQEAVGRVSR